MCDTLTGTKFENETNVHVMFATCVTTMLQVDPFPLSIA